ncbi:MAG TPA: hypothetical protein VIX41_01250 [Acidimicrobiales bacterium]
MDEPKVPRTGAAALALRLAGAGYDEVADALGIASAAEAREQAETALAARAWGDHLGREKMRAENGARIERLLRAVWPKATNAEHPEQLPAVRVARELIDRLARLYGLDAPAEVIIHSPTTAEIEAWVAKVVTVESAALAALEADVVEAEIVDEAS